MRGAAALGSADGQATEINDGIPVTPPGLTSTWVSATRRGKPALWGGNGQAGVGQGAAGNGAIESGMDGCNPT